MRPELCEEEEIHRYVLTSSIPVFPVSYLPAPSNCEIIGGANAAHARVVVRWHRHCNGKLLDVVDGSEHLLRAGAYANIFGEILPAHNAGAIDQKLCWAGDVVAIGSPCDMHQIVTVDYV